ncbi:MAG: acyl-CoA thioesterase [Magnetococcus sp. YQC-9]
METCKLVLPEHLNHSGYPFGGQLLKWVDEAACIAARLDYPQCEFVTVAMDRLNFMERSHLGAILRFEVPCLKVGITSVDYATTVTNALANFDEERLIFSLDVTFVHIGAGGTKQPLPSCLDPLDCC